MTFWRIQMRYRRRIKKDPELIVSAECSIETSLIGRKLNLLSIPMSIIRDELPLQLEEKNPKTPPNLMCFL